MKIWTQSQRQFFFFFFFVSSRLYDLPVILLNIERFPPSPSRGSLVNSKYNWEIRNVIYQATFVRTSVLAKCTCECSAHTNRWPLHGTCICGPCLHTASQATGARAIVGDRADQEGKGSIEKTIPHILRRRLPLRI